MRRRYRCNACGTTFCSTKGTPYYRLQHRRSTFDEVATLSVEGVSKSAIARVKGLAWNTVDRWLERAAECCQQFNDKMIAGVDIEVYSQRGNTKLWTGRTGDDGVAAGTLSGSFQYDPYLVAKKDGDVAFTRLQQDVRGYWVGYYNRQPNSLWRV